MQKLQLTGIAAVSGGNSQSLKSRSASDWSSLNSASLNLICVLRHCSSSSSSRRVRCMLLMLFTQLNHYHSTPGDPLSHHLVASTSRCSQLRREVAPQVCLRDVDLETDYQGANSFSLSRIHATERENASVLYRFWWNKWCYHAKYNKGVTVKKTENIKSWSAQMTTKR